MKIKQYLLVLSLTACASSAPTVPYPAFVQADELPDVYLAGMPGVRAKQFAGDPRSRRTSNRLLLPTGWKGSTGASPGKSVELFVVAGEITLGTMTMKAGSYAYIPAGFTGSNIETDSGAVVLYFLDDANPDAVIQTPLLLDSNLLDWQAASDEAEDFGFSRHSECVEGEALTHDYLPGGYFARPGGAVHGGPESMAITSSVWYLRRMGESAVESVPDCAELPGGAED